MSDKTNAIRKCDQMKIQYEVSDYEVVGGFMDGKEVADTIGKAYDEVFKTLVTIGKSGQVYVFVIPVDQNLDLKKAAVTTKEKSIHLLELNKLLATTGYVKGGCSPIGMKKVYPIYFDAQITKLENITFNAGKVGKQLTLKCVDVEKVVTYQVADLCVQQ